MDQQFAERLKRIETGKQWAPDGVIVAPRAVRKKRSKSGQMAGNAMYPVSILLAFLLGVLTVVVARWARFQLFGAPGEAGEDFSSMVVMDVALSTMLGFVIRQMTNLKSPIHLSAKGFGMTACVLCMHMAVHRFPDLWAIAFSPDWVNSVIQTTSPNGVLFFEFGDGGSNGSGPRISRGGFG